MKRIIIMRHAKSSWNQGLPDHQRPLNKRGRANAPLIARELMKQQWIPDLVISSDATRTKETWQRMESEFSVAPKEVFLNDLYLSGIDEISDAIIQAGESFSTILLLGHNPGWENAVSILSGEDVWLTTANAALLTAPTENWQEALLMSGRWELETVIRPKELD